VGTCLNNPAPHPLTLIKSSQVWVEDQTPRRKNRTLISYLAVIWLSAFTGVLSDIIITSCTTCMHRSRVGFYGVKGSGLIRIHMIHGALAWTELDGGAYRSVGWQWKGHVFLMVLETGWLKAMKIHLS